MLKFKLQLLLESRLRLTVSGFEIENLRTYQYCNDLRSSNRISLVRRFRVYAAASDSESLQLGLNLWRGRVLRVHCCALHLSFRKPDSRTCTLRKSGTPKMDETSVRAKNPLQHAKSTVAQLSFPVISQSASTRTASGRVKQRVREVWVTARLGRERQGDRWKLHSQ
jgi:hypothetical protein